MAVNSRTVTQSDIARKVGVTQQSVALALKGHPSVSRATRQRIEQVAKELGYDAFGQAAARTLIARRYGKKIKTGVIAVTVVAGNEPMRGMPFFFPIMEGIEQYAGLHGIDIYTWFQLSERPIPRLIREGGVDGVICPAGIVMPAMPGNSLPTVFFTKWEGNYVAIDDHEAARIAVKHLAGLGHRRIAYFGWGDSTLAGTERYEGFLRGMREFQLPVDESLIDISLYHFQNLSEAAEAFFRRADKFTALICYNDTVAMEAVRTLERMGLKIPDDVSVVGIDDVAGVDSFHPSLTSVGYDRTAMGRRAAQVIDELSDRLVRDGFSGDDVPFIHETVPVYLVERASTRPIHAESG